MSDREHGSERTIPVEPPVHVETVPTHHTLTWKGGPLAVFLTAVRDTEQIPPTASVLVEDRSVAGRNERRVAEVDASETIRYLRVDPDAPWTLSWERRTWPVVSVSGAPPSELCRHVHRVTTDCDGWSGDAVETLHRVIAAR